MGLSIICVTPLVLFVLINERCVRGSVVFSPVRNLKSKFLYFVSYKNNSSRTLLSFFFPIKNLFSSLPLSPSISLYLYLLRLSPSLISPILSPSLSLSDPLPPLSLSFFLRCDGTLPLLTFSHLLIMTGRWKFGMSEPLFLWGHLRCVSQHLISEIWCCKMRS